MKPTDHPNRTRMIRFLFANVAVVLALSAATDLRADDYSRLQDWFSKPDATRGGVPEQVDGILKDAAAVQPAADKVWQAYKSGAVALGWDKDLPMPPLTFEAVNAMSAEQRTTMTRGQMADSGKEMPFFLLAKGAKGTNGWPFFLSMHGGGMAASPNDPHGSRMNNSEWQAQVRLFASIYPDGLYFIPRMADDNDGRWWYYYCQAIYDRAIRRAILFRDVDPNRVYVMGISEGGYAAYRLGAHMADRWAGACALAAAEPLDTSPPENFRNLPFRCGIGELDAMFDRIGLARRYFEKLDDLARADGATNAYLHLLDAQKGRGHGIDYRPGPEWIAQFERNPWPRRVVWTAQPLHGLLRRQMYWLALDQAPEKGPLFLDATIVGNTVTLKAEQPGAKGARIPANGITLRVYLNDHLVDLNKSVKLIVNGTVVQDRKVPRRVATLARSLDERGDRCFMFPADMAVRLRGP
jgi:pimeloyl-ACP methyl ester carboxylesterase